MFIKRCFGKFIAPSSDYSRRISQIESVSLALSAKIDVLDILTSRVTVRMTRISPVGSVAVAVISAFAREPDFLPSSGGGAVYLRFQGVDGVPGDRLRGCSARCVVQRPQFLPRVSPEVKPDFSVYAVTRA